MSPAQQVWAFVLAWSLCLLSGLGLTVCFKAGAQAVVRRWALAAPLGLALLSIALIIFVQWDVPLSQVTLPLGLAMGSGGALAAWAGRSRLMPRSSAERKELAWLAGAQGVSILLLLLPIVLGGINYFAFRGNKWDCYGYNAMALSLDHLSLSRLTTASLKELIDLHPVYVLMHEHHLHDRLGTGAVLAFFARMGSMPAVDFQTALSALGMALCAPLYFLMGRGQGLRRDLAAGLALALSVCFWSSFVRDDNQLAHAHSQSLLLLAIAGLGLLPRSLGVATLAIALAGLAAANAGILPFVVLGLGLWWVFNFKAPLAKARFAAALWAGVVALACIAAFWPFLLGHLKLMAGAVGGAKAVNFQVYHYPWLFDPSTPTRVVPAFWSLEPLNRSWAIYWGLGWALCIVAGLGLYRQARGKAGFMGRALFAVTVAQAANTGWLLANGEFFIFCRSLAYGFVVGAPVLAAAAGGRRAKTWAVWVVMAFALIQSAWAAGQVLQAARGRLDVPKFPTHLDSKERELDHDWRPITAALKADPKGVLALDISLPWVQERAEHVFADRPLWRVRPLLHYHVAIRGDELLMTRPTRIEWVLVEKRRYSKGIQGAALAAETPELALYKMAAKAEFKPRQE